MPAMTDWVAAVLIVTGALFMFIAALGLVRMPDLLTRMHATTKAAVFGVGLVLVGVCVHFATAMVLARAVAIVFFVLLTAPVAAHAIARAGYFIGVPLWKGTVRDDMKDRYDADTHHLASGEPPPGDAGPDG